MTLCKGLSFLLLRSSAVSFSVKKLLLIQLYISGSALATGLTPEPLIYSWISNSFLTPNDTATTLG